MSDPSQVNDPPPSDPTPEEIEEARTSPPDGRYLAPSDTDTADDSAG